MIFLGENSDQQWHQGCVHTERQTGQYTAQKMAN